MKRSLYSVLLICSFLVVKSVWADATIEKVADIQKPTTVPTVLATASVMSAPSAQTTPVAGFSPEHLKGTWAIGAGMVGAGGYCLTARNWVENDFGVDLFVGGSYQGVANPIQVYSTDQWSYSLGLGMRQVLARPVKDVLVELLVQLSYQQEQSDDYENQSTPYTSTYQNLNLFIGPGFEAFVPFWENLSVEASIGLYVGSKWSESNNQAWYGYANEWQWSAGIGNNNTSFSPFSAAVHFYF